MSHLHSVEFCRAEIDGCPANDFPLADGFEFKQALSSAKDHLQVKFNSVDSPGCAILAIK